MNKKIIIQLFLIAIFMVFEQYGMFRNNLSAIKNSLTPAQCKLLQLARKRSREELPLLFQQQLSELDQKDSIHFLRFYSEKSFSDKSYEFFIKQCEKFTNVELLITSKILQEQKDQFKRLIAAGCFIQELPHEHEVISLNQNKELFIHDSKIDPHAARIALVTVFKPISEKISLKKEIVSDLIYFCSVNNIDISTYLNEKGFIEGLNRVTTAQEHELLDAWWQRLSHKSKDVAL